MSRMLKKRDRCMCPDYETTCQLRLENFLTFYTKQAPQEFILQKNLDEYFGNSLFNQNHKNAIYLIELLLSRLSKLIEQPLEHVEQFEGPISSTWESLKMLYNRIEHDAQKAFLKDLEKCFKDTHKDIQSIVTRMSEGQQDINMWLLKTEQMQKDMEILYDQINNYSLVIEFAELSSHFQSQHHQIRLVINGKLPCTFFLLGAVKFIYLESMTQRFDKISPKSIMNATLNLMTPLLSLVKGYDMKYLQCLELSLERKHTIAQLAGYRNMIHRREISLKNSFFSSIERIQIPYSEEHFTRIRQKLLKITTRFQLGNLIDSNSINLIIKSLHCIRKALVTQITTSERDQFYFRFVSMLLLWKEKSILFNSNSRLLPLFVRELQDLINHDRDLRSRFLYTLYSDFYEVNFLATTTKFLHITSKILAQETRIFELYSILKAIQKKLGQEFLQQSSLSHFSDSSESECKFVVQKRTHSLAAAKRILRDHYKQFIHKMHQNRLKVIKATKTEFLQNVNRKSKNLLEAVKSCFHSNPQYPNKEDFILFVPSYIHELENSLNSLEIVVELTYRCLNKGQPQIQLLCYLQFPYIADFLEKKDKTPFNILKDIMGPQNSNAIVISDFALQSHFSFQLGLVECIGRYLAPDKNDSLMKYHRHFKSRYSIKDVGKFYISKAKEFFTEQAQFLGDLQCRSYLNSTPQMCAFFYVTYALGGLENPPLNVHDAPVVNFYKTVIELFPYASVIDMLWRIYWVLVPVLGKTTLERHLRVSGQFLLDSISNQLFNSDLNWGEKDKIEKERRNRKEQKKVRGAEEEKKQKPKSMQPKLGGGTKRSVSKISTRQTQLTEMFSLKEEKAEESELQPHLQLEMEVFTTKSLQEKCNLLPALKSYLAFVRDLVKSGEKIEYEGLWSKTAKCCWSCCKFLERDRLYMFNEMFILCPFCKVQNMQRMTINKPEDLKKEAYIAPRFSFQKLKYFEGKKKVIYFNQEEMRQLHGFVQELMLKLIYVFEQQITENRFKMAKSKETICPVLCMNVDFNQIDKFGKLAFSFLRDLLIIETTALDKIKQELHTKVEQIFFASLQISDYFNGLKETIRGSLQLLEDEKAEHLVEEEEFTLENAFVEEFMEVEEERRHQFI